MVCTCKRVLWAIVLAAATASGCAPEVPRRDERRQIQPLPGADGGGMLLLDAEAPAPQPPDAPPSSAPQCGNGKLETGEVCDGDSRACTEIDPAAFDGGAAACNSTCSSYDTKSCSRPATLADAIGTITEAVLKQDLGVIAADDHNGRYPGSAGELKTRSYLTSGLSSFGLKPAPTGAGLLQSFSWNGTPTANVVAVMPGTDPTLKDEVVIVGAHHDHLGTTSDYGCKAAGGNSICNGADDNGTGAIAVLALARALSKLQGQNRRTLVFMMFGAEEKGLVGSKHYVQNPLYPLSKTVYMINIDMIGDSSGGKVSALGASRSQLATQWINDAAGKYGVSATPTQSAGSGSDHYHFALSQVPYVFFHTGISACYHATCDTVEKIYYPEYAKITRAIAHFMWTLSQSDQSPRSDFVAPTSCAALDTDWKAFQLYWDHQPPGGPTPGQGPALP